MHPHRMYALGWKAEPRGTALTMPTLHSSHTVHPGLSIQTDRKKAMSSHGGDVKIKIAHTDMHTQTHRHKHLYTHRLAERRNSVIVDYIHSTHDALYFFQSISLCTLHSCLSLRVWQPQPATELGVKSAMGATRRSGPVAKTAAVLVRISNAPRPCGLPLGRFADFPLPHPFGKELACWQQPGSTPLPSHLPLAAFDPRIKDRPSQHTTRSRRYPFTPRPVGSGQQTHLSTRQTNIFRESRST